MIKKHISKKCLSCEKLIIPNWEKSHGWATIKFCSRKCYWSSLKNKKLSEETKKKISEYRKKKPVKSVFKKGHLFGKRFKKGQIPWNKGKEWKEMQGENHPNWNNGVSEKNRKHNRHKSKKLAKETFRRDGWIYTDCKRKERILNAHHIKEWKNYPNLRFNPDNLITLCVDCHKKRHYKKQ